MKKGLLLFGLLAGVAAVAIARSRHKVNNRPVDEFDPSRYMGRWYEIARFNHPFERGMDRVTADYTLLPDGTIEVVNSGYKQGRYKQIKGKGKQDPSGRPGHLKVKFFVVYSDYLVMKLDTENYSYALVGSSSPDFLWILGREPHMPVTTLNMLINEAAARGYDVSKLLFIDQR